jgi:hypothetical protein
MSPPNPSASPPPPRVQVNSRKSGLKSLGDGGSAIHLQYRPLESNSWRRIYRGKSSGKKDHKKGVKGTQA